jgi:carbon-monoxide dehydrogenase medium subunit
VKGVFARPGLPHFEYVRAATPDEAVGLLEEHGSTARPLMGGTDLFANMRDGKVRPTLLVDVKHLPGMRDIVYDEGTGLTVGAAVTMNELARHTDVLAHYPLLAQAAEKVASYQVRNRATIGGNLCNASPCADTTPVTLTLEAELVLYGPRISASYARAAYMRNDERVVPAGEFFKGPGWTALWAGELMTAIRFPTAPANSAARYLKLGRCRSGDLSLVAVAVLAYPDDTGLGYRFRIGLGSVAPTALRAGEAEALLAVEPPGEESFARAAGLAMAAASPITDVRGTAEYQKAMVRTLTLRGLRDVWAQLHSA